MTIDEMWMKEALLEAEKARMKGEVPVGSVVVKDTQIIARAFNQPISSCNPVAHSEILALQAASATIGNYRLLGCDLYVTLEPCAMCAGAVIHSRIGRLIFGAAEPKSGVVMSVLEMFEQPWVNHRVAVTGGVLQTECSEIMKNFFRARRQQIREEKTQKKHLS